MIIPKIWQWRFIYFGTALVLSGVLFYAFNLNKHIDQFVAGEVDMSDRRILMIKEAAQFRESTAIKN